MENVIEFHSVYKIYRGSVEALRGATFTIPSGVIAGLVGPNGAGKTTSFKLALGFLRPNSGRVYTFGLDPWREEDKVRRKIGYLPEKPIYPANITVEDLLEHITMSKQLPLSEVRKVERITGIEEYHSRPIGSLSRGYIQRLGLATTLIGEPELLLLDEPTANLDPAARIEILELIKTFAEDLGVTVVVSTHILPEMQQIANYLVVIKDGVIVEHGYIGDLAQKYYAETIYEIKTAEPRTVARELIGEEFIVGIEVSPSKLIVKIARGTNTQAESLFSRLLAKRLIEDYRLVTGSIQDLYFKLTSKEE